MLWLRSGSLLCCFHFESAAFRLVRPVHKRDTSILGSSTESESVAGRRFLRATCGYFWMQPSNSLGTSPSKGLIPSARLESNWHAAQTSLHYSLLLSRRMGG